MGCVKSCRRLKTPAVMRWEDVADGEARSCLQPSWQEDALSYVMLSTRLDHCADDVPGMMEGVSGIAVKLRKHWSSESEEGRSYQSIVD